MLPRWWSVRPEEMHAAALYQRAGEELMVTSASNPQVKDQVLRHTRRSLVAGANREDDTSSRTNPTYCEEPS